MSNNFAARSLTGVRVELTKAREEIDRLRAENAELRASYERVDKHASELSQQREKQADMIREWNPLYR